MTDMVKLDEQQKVEWLASFQEGFDNAAVDAFANVLKAKLADSRAKGRGGWHRPEEVSHEALVEALNGHIAKGDPRDVALFAMFLHYHSMSTVLPEPVAA